MLQWSREPDLLLCNILGKIDEPLLFGRSLENVLSTHPLCYWQNSLKSSVVQSACSSSLLCSPQQ